LTLLAAQSMSGQHILNNTPAFVSTAENIGEENTSKVISVTLWVQLHNRGLLDDLARNLYDKNSPNYRHWLKPSDLRARFAPGDDEVKVVKQFLTERNLKVTKVGPANFSVTAEGTVADVERAFDVEIDRFKMGSEVHRANTSDPSIAGPAGALVSAVYGLDDFVYKHPIQQAKAINPATHQPLPAASGGFSPDLAFFSGRCFTGVQTETLTTGGGLPKATYTGNGYGAGPAFVPECGYSPSEIHTAYKLNGLYAEGFHGEGQSIVIIDWCGSTTITQDANLFSKVNGLPKLTSSNFSIIDYPVPSTCASEGDPEISIDVEWAHAIAPRANIVLLVLPSATFADIDNATAFAVLAGLGNVISGSYGAPETLVSPTILSQNNLISELAAVSGISANYSSGDCGDFAPCTLTKTVSTPADSPWATAVGGVTLALKPDNTIAWQTGWGNNQTLLWEEGTIFVPPINFGFFGGSGGGPSSFFPKPFFQKAAHVPGTGRQVPDISWLADPYTGVEIALSVPGQYPPQAWQVWGGTSVACPMFSALWAIANQVAGGPLGQAAQYVYSLPSGAVTDIVPWSGAPHNVTGTIHQATKPTTINYSALQLAACPASPWCVPPLDGTKLYESALWTVPSVADTLVLLTFGTDSSLKTTVGWDNVTGVGTPNGKAFANAFKQ
jgi:subtilase family serine protease